MTNPLERAGERAVEKAAESLIKQLQGRTPDDTHYVCATVHVPDTNQRVRVCVEPHWDSQTRPDPATNAPVTIHVSPEYSKAQVREAVQQQMANQQQRQLPSPDGSQK